MRSLLLVDGIPRWITPAMLDGVTACIQDVTEFRRSDRDCGKGFHDSRQNPIQRTVRMVLTGDGWMTEHAYERLING